VPSCFSLSQTFHCAVASVLPYRFKIRIKVTKVIQNDVIAFLSHLFKCEVQSRKSTPLHHNDVISNAMAYHCILEGSFLLLLSCSLAQPSKDGSSTSVKDEGIL